MSDWSDKDAQAIFAQCFPWAADRDEKVTLIAAYLRLAHARGIDEGINRCDAVVKDVFAKHK